MHHWRLPPLPDYKLSNPPAAWIAPLKHCAEAYKKTLTLWVPQAIEALNKGKPKVAENAVFGSGGSSTECAIGFSGSKSPLTVSVVVSHLLLL